MTLYAIMPLACFLLFFVLGLFLLFHRPKTKEKTLLSLLCFEAFYWQVVWFTSFFTSNPHFLDYLAKISYLAISFLPFTFYHFIVSYLKLKKETKFVFLFYGLGVVMASLLPTNQFVTGHQHFSWGNFAAPGPLYPIYMISALLTMTRGIFVLNGAYQNPSSYGISRNQLRYVFLGLLLYYSCAVDFLQVYGAPWYPTGAFFFLGSFFVLSYAIVRHRLMDIEIIIKRTLVFTGIFSFFLGIFAFLSFLITDVLQSAVTPTVRFWIFAAGATIAALVVNRLHSFLVDVTDRFLFQKKFDYHKLLKENSKQIAFIQSLDELARQVVVFLIKQGRVKNAAIFTYSELEGGFVLRYPIGYGGKTKRPAITLNEHHPLIQRLEETKSPIQTVEIEDELRESRLKENGKANQLSEIFQILKSLKAVVVIPSFLGISFNGFKEANNRPVLKLRNILILGSKKSDEDYSEEDLDVFFTIAQDSAIAVENARLFDTVLTERESKLKAQTEAKMVSYAKTIGHEIKNALVGIEGPAIFFQRHQVADLRQLFDRYLKDKTPMAAQNKYLDICEKIDKQAKDIFGRVQKIRVIASTAQGTLRSSEDSFGEIYFKILWETAKEESGVADLQYDVRIPDNFIIYGNLILLQRVFINLINNAAEAMDVQKDKRVDLRGHYEEVSGQPLAVFEFKDYGPGIRQEIQDKIFLQDFSTKPKPNVADIQASGHGQGLYVCKEIIETIHRGKIEVRSLAGEGATFVFWLPLQAGQK